MKIFESNYIKALIAFIVVNAIPYFVKWSYEMLSNVPMPTDAIGFTVGGCVIVSLITVVIILLDEY